MVIKNALKRKISSNINGGKSTEINPFLTEPTPKFNRLTDRSNFSRIPNPTVVWMLDSHPVRLEDPPRVHVLRGGRAGESPQQVALPPAALVGQGKVVEQARVPLGQAPLWPGGGDGSCHR